MDAITKTEIRFWIAIITVVVTSTTAFVSLSKDVEAMTAREQLNRGQFYDMVEKLENINEIVIKIDKNQALIMRELGIE